MVKVLAPSAVHGADWTLPALATRQILLFSLMGAKVRLVPPVKGMS